MSNGRKPEEIEREIEQDREGLQDTLVALRESFTPDAIFRSITDNVGRHGGEFGRSVSDAARGNPLALGLTGIGLGWLIFGRGPSANQIDSEARRLRSNSDGIGGGRSTAYGEDADATIGPRGPVPDGDGPNWIRDEDRGPSMGQRMRAKWRRTGDSASRRAGRVRDRSSDMRRRLSEGTEKMSADARERIISARERAILAREQARDRMGQGADRATEFFEEYPLAAGALAFAVGAAIAGSMPRTRYEDEHFGAESDRLYEEAERLFSEERAKAERVAGAAMDEARNIGKEAKDRADSGSDGSGTAGDAAVDKTEEAARRVADAAEDQARKEDLGPSRSS